jgi:AraC-like DNA-binding protein
MSKVHAERVISAEFRRPPSGPVFVWEQGLEGVPLSGLPGWQSNELTRIQLVGVFALYASNLHEAPGTLGASIQVAGENATEARFDLLNHRHYRDASVLADLLLTAGDGTSLETVGRTEVSGLTVRVDKLTIDLPNPIYPTKIVFRDLGSPASFVLFDVAFSVHDVSGCPFHSHGGGVSLGEIASIVRLGDRVRLCAALDQLCESLGKAEDVDEARGQALTFLSMVTAATLEMGGSRSMHRVLLQAAREFDRCASPQQIGDCSRRWVEEVAPGIFRDSDSPSSKLVDRALSLVDRNFARDLTDSVVASQLGLSTSHFRFLFKQATGQPFHKYLIALRLEKARMMLVEQEISVGVVAKSVGFAGLSHFSRAFTQRFHVSPTAIRKSS